MRGTSLSRVTGVVEEGGGRPHTAAGMGDRPFSEGKVELRGTLAEEGQVCRIRIPIIPMAHNSQEVVIQ